MFFEFKSTHTRKSKEVTIGPQPPPPAPASRGVKTQTDPWNLNTDSHHSREKQFTVLISSSVFLKHPDARRWPHMVTTQPRTDHSRSCHVGENQTGVGARAVEQLVAPRAVRTEQPSRAPRSSPKNKNRQKARS